MIVYLDSTIVLRRLLMQPGRLSEWPLIREPLSSRLIEVECLRTLDRLRVKGEYAVASLSSLREGLYRFLTSFDLIEVSRTVLARAAQPCPTPIGTLDALHLSSALVARERTGRNIAFATHDEALAIAARAYGFRVIGA